jgi:hypothetical protein
VLVACIPALRLRRLFSDGCGLNVMMFWRRGRRYLKVLPEGSNKVRSMKQLKSAVCAGGRAVDVATSS